MAAQKKKTAAPKPSKASKAAKDEPGEKKPAQAESKQPAEDQKPFPIVGIGASAGGLEALEAFFENLPVESGMAFVIITHTDPKRDSLLPEIIKRKTKVTVKQIEEATPIETNTVYLPPSDRDPFIAHKIFRLKNRPAKDRLHMPVDLFLRHLAEERGERAACVILSGTGSDGTQGLRAIKEKSGLAVVQDPNSARHTGMPTSALDTGLVDFVLAPEEMPERLIEYFRHPVAMQPAAPRKSKKEPDSLKQVLAHLAKRTRHDFSLYKSSTLKRRIARRIAVTRSRDAAEYLKTLYRDNQEVQALFQDLLIGVTSFFRDPDAFAFLIEHALADLFNRKREGQALRVWVPACATGEEAYSVAIILKEYMETNDLTNEMQIFATDIDPHAIEKARSGEYLENIAADVGTQRLKRFFTKENGRYRVKRDIREAVVFAEQNLLRDPPFSNLDLLVCRNLLIYLKSEAQGRLIPLFHYTLHKNGILFLGNSETIGRFPELFEPLSKSFSIFRKKETAVELRVRFPTGKAEAASLDAEAEDREYVHTEEKISLEKAVEKVLMQEFTPACVVVDPDGEILYTSGRSGKYLELGRGRPNLNIADMAREGLRFPLTSALRKAGKTEAPIYVKGLKVRTNSKYQEIDLTVKRFSRPPLEDAVLVVFEERSTPEEKSAASNPDRADASQKDRIERLEQELLRMGQEYRSAREELETSNEELRSTNEEMQSSNEELQSTNEELESSREELQSLNEELNTVNDELQNKITELRDSYRAIAETLDSTRIAIVFLDKDLRVVRFTQTAAELINLIDTDAGRPLEHISNNLAYEDLCKKAAEVLDTLSPFEKEVKTEDGHWYRMNIMVHRKGDHVIEGVVLTFVNIDPQKKAQQEIEAIKAREVRSAERFAENIVDTVRESLLVLDEQMRVITANRRFFQTFATESAQTEGKSLFELGDGQWDIPELRRLLKQTIAQHQAFEDYRVEDRFAEVGFKQMLLNARHLQEERNDQNRILLAIEDVTDR
jgi:two-component system CheB/CheR fusion protein